MEPEVGTTSDNANALKQTVVDLANIVSAHGEDGDGLSKNTKDNDKANQRRKSRKKHKSDEQRANGGGSGSTSTSEIMESEIPPLEECELNASVRSDRKHGLLASVFSDRGEIVTDIPTSSRRTNCVAVILGQILSAILCVSAVTSVYLTDVYDLHISNSQNFVFYIMLSIVFTSILASRPDEANLFVVLKNRGWQYALVAVADAEANFLVVKAYQYTTLTSVQLLDCFTIPTVLVLSFFMLKIRYKPLHLVGVFVSLVGVCFLVWADVETGIPLGLAKEKVIGDVLCLSGAFLYGVSNVAQEFLVKTFDITEFLGMVGLFGSIVTGIQAVIFETGQVTMAVVTGSPVPIYLVFGFALAQLSFYVMAAALMRLSGATTYNLSILTADFYSLVVGIFLFQYQFHTLYFVSFVLVIAGVVIFSIKAIPTVGSEAAENRPINGRYEINLETEQRPHPSMSYQN